MRSATDWLIERCDTGELPVELIRKLDGEDIQDAFQSDMEADGFFTPKYEWMIENAETDGMIYCLACEMAVPDDHEPDVCDTGNDEGYEPEKADIAGVRDYLHDTFPEDDNPPTELYEFGKEKGWWA